MTSPDSPTPDWVTADLTTGTPDWATGIPATPAVHPKETGGLTRPLTNQQLAKIGKQLLEQFLRQIVLALTGMFLPNGGTSLAQLMKWAQELAAELASMRSLTDWMAFTGSNLVLDPHFDSLINFTRFPVAPAQICDYTHDLHHSGLKAWQWWHFPSTDSGLILAPTTHVDYFSVGATESYFVECWIYPAATNSVSTGSIRIGATVSDSGSILADTDIYMDCPLNGPDVVRGQWNKINTTVEIPTGYDTAKFWVKSTAATAADSVFTVDDVTVRENTSGVKAEIQAALANRAVELRARAGSNLVVSPTFSNNLVERYPYNTNQLYSYAAGVQEKKHSGFQSWKWTQETGAACGLILAPTTTVDSYEVKAGESFFVEAYLYPSGIGTTGAVRIGGTFTDSGDVLADTDLYLECPLSGPDVVAGQWNKVNTTITVPEGYDTAKFWVITTAEVTAGSTWWVDDVTVREGTLAAQALAEAKLANFITDVKAKTSANTVVDPTFGLGALVARFPYNTMQTYGYSTAQHYSGLVSWTWTQKTNAACGFVMNPTAKVDRYQVRDGEQYLVEARILALNSNPGTTGALRIGGTFTDADNMLTPVDVYTETLMTAVTKGTWMKLSATVDIPDGGYDTAKFWVIATAATTANSVFYLDDVSVRDAAALAAGNKAAVAQQNIQTVVDNIHQAINGGTQLANPLATVKQNIQNAWAKFVDGLRGHTAGTTTAAIADDVYTAAAAVKAEAATAITNAATAQDTAEEATSIASISKGYNLVDNPGFENSSLPLCGMGGFPPESLTYATDIVHDGTQSVRTVGTQRIYFNQAIHTVGYWVGAPIDVQPGDQFYCEAYCFNPTGNAYCDGGYMAVMAEYWDRDGVTNPLMVSILDAATFESWKGPGFLDFNDSSKLPIGQWTRLWGYFTVPAGAYKMAVAIHVYPARFGQPDAANVYYWDSPLLMRAESQAALDQAIAANATASTAIANAAAANTVAENATFQVQVAARDYTNIAAGSDFESWTPERPAPSGGVTSDCIQPWVLGTSRWSANAGHIYWGPGGYIETPEPGRDYAGFPAGHCLMATAGEVVTYTTLKTFPVAQSGEQFYIEFLAMKDSYFNGTDALSRLRVGYNDDDIFLDAVPYGTAQFDAPLQWKTFSKTITVPPGAEYLRFSLGANHNVTNSSEVSVAGRDGNNHWLQPGQGGRIYLDNIVIRRVVPPEGVELLPQDKVTNLPINLAAVSAYRGANILPNGDFEDSSYVFKDADGAPTVPGINCVYSTANKHSGSQSVRMDAGTLGWARVIMPLNPIKGDIDYIQCSADGSDVFLAECWVRGDSTNSYPAAQILGGYTGGFGMMLWPKDLDVVNPAYWFHSFVGCVGLGEAVRTECHGVWYRVQAVFSPPVGVTAFTLAAEGQGRNNKWFVDDFTCYRITEGAVAQAVATTAQTTASTAQTTATTASATADTATTNLQTVVDGTVQAVDGGTATGATPATHKSKLQLAWAHLWMGLSGNTGATAKLPTDVKTAAASVKSTSDSASTVAGAATTNVQTAVDGVTQAVYGITSTNNAPATVKTALQKMLGGLFDGFNGTQGTESKSINDVYTASAQVTASAATAQSTASAASTQIDSTNTALFGSTSVGSAILAAAVPNLSAGKITSGKLSSSVLPTGTGAVGSGFLIRKTSGTINVSCSANTVTANKFAASSYDSTPSSTDDYTVSTPGGELRVTAANPGWYLAEVSFGIKQTTRVVGYRIAPMLFLNGNAHKVGSTVDYDGSLNARIPFAAQAAFIVYLNNGDYVTPGAVLNSQSTISGLDIIGTNFNQDTYFSVSLLNRSLA